MKLLSTSTKIEKSNSFSDEYLSTIQYLAPHDKSGYNVCSFASEGCTKACLFTAGRGRYKNIQDIRINRTKFFFEDRKSYIKQLYRELTTFCRRSKKLGLKPAIRLNGTSDLDWAKYIPSIYRDWPHVQWYEYTKNPYIINRYISGNLPDNLYLLFSRSENNENHCKKFLAAGINVAVVFWNRPAEYLGYPVIDGDVHDLRFLDQKNVVVGLSPKGRAKHDITSFVV